MLLVLDDVLARKPGARRHAAVDDHERILLQRIRHRLNTPNKVFKISFLLATHAPRFLAAI